MPGILYIVATPIGNLEDITLRGLRVLKEVDLIAAEDTRHTQKLLIHYGITQRLTSYHEHNERVKARVLIEQLKEGKRVALVSDAGTPAISDPGYRLVREAVSAGIAVVPIPGPSALAAVLSASGLPTDRVVFEGFLPPKKGERRRRLEALKDESRTMVFYEAPHRLKDCLDDLLQILGDREIVLAREVSKIYEEFLRGSLSGVKREAENRDTLRGEVTLVVKGLEEERDKDPDKEELLRGEIERLKRKGMHVKEIAALLGEKFSYPKREIYRLVLEARGSRKAIS
jgi:16S rRNA (cytidine1402-2'-O)-methyltransferase